MSYLVEDGRKHLAKVWREDVVDIMLGKELLGRALDEIERLRALVPEQEGASEALPEARSADTPTSPNAREEALEWLAGVKTHWAGHPVAAHAETLLALLSTSSGE